MKMPTTSVDTDDGDYIALDDADPDDVADSERWPNERVIGAYLHQKKKHNAQNTYEARRTQLRRLHAWLDERGEHISDVTPSRVQAFIDDHADAGYRASSAQAAGEGVADFFSTLRDDFGVDVSEHNSGGDPTDVTLSELDATSGQSIAEASSGKQRSYVTKEGKDQLLDNVPDPVTRNKVLVQLMWETGFRRSTMARIEVDDIDRGEQVVEAYSPKVDKSVTATYSDAVASQLDLYLDLYRGGYLAADTSDRLFLGEKGPLTPERVGMIVREAAEKAGIQEVVAQDVAGRERHRVTAHKLRHGLAHHLLHQQDVDIETVRAQLGHSDISITQTYVKQEESERLQTMRDEGPAGRTEPL
jgi:integrase/recombinase XerD